MEAAAAAAGPPWRAAPRHGCRTGRSPEIETQPRMGGDRTGRMPVARSSASLVVGLASAGAFAEDCERVAPRLP